MPFRYCLVLCLLLRVAALQAQEIIEAPAPGSGIRAVAGVIVNRSFSNIGEKVEVIDDFSRITRSRSDSAPAAKGGFLIGLEALLGKKEGFKGAFGLSITRSAAEYHSSYTEEGPTSRAGFTSMSRATELDYKESYLYADIHAGMRNRIFKQVYLTSALAFSKPLVTQRESKGYVLTTYSTSGSPDTESTIAYLTDPKKKVKGESNLSLRFRLEYEIPVGDSRAAFFIFRNLGLIYTLPWWGIGGTFSF